MSSRDPKIIAAYDTYKMNLPKECPFCVLGDRSIAEAFKHFNILYALFPYSRWDDRPVKHHLMAVPKRHHTIFEEFSDKEARELLHIMTVYEKRGYSVYARAPQDTTRSVSHQHTHLLLLER